MAVHKAVLKKFALVAGILGSILLACGVAVTVLVEREGAYVHENLGGGSMGKALILYHPSLDAHFSDDLSLALAEGLKSVGFTVERTTLTQSTPTQPQTYQIICVVSNTYYWTPDLPTLAYLKRAHLDKIPVIGLIGGAGSTGRAQKVFEQALRSTGASILQIRPFWLWRPNAEGPQVKSNHQLAMDQARQIGMKAAQDIIAGRLKAK